MFVAVPSLMSAVWWCVQHSCSTGQCQRSTRSRRAPPWTASVGWCCPAVADDPPHASWSPALNSSSSWYLQPCRRGELRREERSIHELKIRNGRREGHIIRMRRKTSGQERRVAHTDTQKQQSIEETQRSAVIQEMVIVIRESYRVTSVCYISWCSVTYCTLVWTVTPVEWACPNQWVDGHHNNIQTGLPILSNQYHLVYVTRLRNVRFTQKNHCSRGIKATPTSPACHLYVFSCVMKQNDVVMMS